jgi:hypothetical protein
VNLTRARREVGVQRPRRRAVLGTGGAGVLCSGPAAGAQVRYGPVLGLDLGREGHNDLVQGGRTCSCVLCSASWRRDRAQLHLRVPVIEELSMHRKELLYIE